MVSSQVPSHSLLSSQPSDPEPAAMSPAIAFSEQSLDAYADQLMDDLFGDLEQLLDKTVQLPDELVQPEAVQPHPLPLQLNLAPLIPVPAAILESLEPGAIATDEAVMTDLDLAEPDLLTSTEGPEQRRSSRMLDTLLLVATGAALVAVGTLWFTLKQSWQPQPTATDSLAEQLQTQANTEFLSYLQRSLAAIDRRTEINRQSVATSPEQGEMPFISVTGNASPTNENDVIERIYVPVYRPPQPLVPPQMPATAALSPALAIASPVPNASVVVPAIIPLPAVRPSIIAAPPAPVAVAPNTPTPLPAGQTSGVDNGSAQIPNIATGGSHTLVGILELGERSAALFDINGSVQTIRIGESIGSSGWTLVSVSAEGAIVRRNGEVRTIYNGQRF